ncbi:hypothetical protein [Myxococcus sp. RHSTA-1-4]|uniref:hypothetical protein n=1 Tax=Myxococcus sp. RHSTA-1-4 TaxID=2874601 RepID=UPI001CBB8C65|nr:hypothetical protein [Myxococcus sp. RHSTA-1-4]MBZ4419125.1 hypothetical protein [Myxococcus sp. RHSTA-1-4]
MAADSSAPPSPVDAAPPDSPVPSPELQRLWFALERRAWNFLTVVPAHPGAPALEAAAAVLEAGAPYAYSQKFHLQDATGISPTGASRLVLELRERVARGERVVVVLDSLITRPASLPLALAADGCLLCVTLGETDFGTARKTIEFVGHERFVGSVTFPRQKKKGRARQDKKKKP